MMQFRLTRLELVCREKVERIEFANRLSFFHGEMSAGKSSIPALVDYCLGGRFPRTPALAAELVSVSLQLRLGAYDVLIERAPTDAAHAQVSWKGDDGVGHQVSAPFQADTKSSPLLGDTVRSFSDVLLYLLGIGVIKVRKRTYDEESNLVRLSIRDILEFAYLDQDHLDSDFFLLDMPLRKEKSQDAFRYFVGFMSERLNELQIQLQEARQNQRTKRETATQIQSFLNQFGFASVEKIEAELNALNDEARDLEQRLEEIRAGYNPDSRIADEDRGHLKEVDDAVLQSEEAMSDLKTRIREQENLISELVSLKFKATRTEVARTVLDKVAFDVCPVCGSGLPEAEAQNLDQCYLCHTPNDLQPSMQSKAVDILRQDLNERIADLKDSVARHKRAIDPLQRRTIDLRIRRKEIDDRLSSALRNYESEYLARSRASEKRISAIQARSALLAQIIAMPAEIVRIQEQADALSTVIDELRRKIAEEEAKLVGAEKNYKAVEANLKTILLAIGFPGFASKDEVVINRRSLIPEIWQFGDHARAWTFFDAGSGGKKTLLKICFALALHQTAAENGLPVPSFLMIDSPMKNITPDVNPAIFASFYTELYRLLLGSLSDWQVVLVDQTYAPPPPTLPDSLQRFMTRDDDNNPPLISYYRGA